MIHCVNLNATLDLVFLMPRLRLGAVNRAPECFSYPGGKAGNVARGAAALGGRARLVGFCGRHEAAGLAAWYKAAGVAPDFEPVTGHMRPCLVLNEGAAGRETVINSPARVEPSAAAARALAKRLLGAVRAGDLVVFAGTLPAALPAGYFSALIRRVQARKAVALFDSSGPGLKDGLTARPFVVKPNLAELEEYCGRRLRGEAALRKAMDAVKRRGVPLVVVTLGSRGSRAVSAAGAWAVNAPASPKGALSPVGCGDAFLAGLAYALDGGRGVEEALRWATASAWANLAHPGAGFQTRAEVELGLSRVRVRAWKP